MHEMIMINVFNRRRLLSRRQRRLRPRVTQASRPWPQITADRPRCWPLRPTTPLLRLESSTVTSTAVTEAAGSPRRRDLSAAGTITAEQISSFSSSSRCFSPSSTPSTGRPCIGGGGTNPRNRPPCTRSNKRSIRSSRCYTQ